MLVNSMFLYLSYDNCVCSPEVEMATVLSDKSLLLVLLGMTYLRTGLFYHLFSTVRLTCVIVSRTRSCYSRDMSSACFEYLWFLNARSISLLIIFVVCNYMLSFEGSRT